MSPKLSFGFVTIHACDRQMVGQTDGSTIGKTALQYSAVKRPTAPPIAGLRLVFSVRVRLVDVASS